MRDLVGVIFRLRRLFDSNLIITWHATGNGSLDHSVLSSLDELKSTLWNLLNDGYIPCLKIRWRPTAA